MSKHQDITFTATTSRGDIVFNLDQGTVHSTRTYGSGPGGYNAKLGRVQRNDAGNLVLLRGMTKQVISNSANEDELCDLLEAHAEFFVRRG